MTVLHTPEVCEKLGTNSMTRRRKLDIRSTGSRIVLRKLALAEAVPLGHLFYRCTGVG